jgi:hypothetical protein
MERNHRRILHRWLARGSRRVQVDAQRRDIVRHSFGGYRGCVDWVQQDDGGQHEARCSTATTERCRCTIWRRWYGGCCVDDFDQRPLHVRGGQHQMQKDGQLHMWSSGVLWDDLAYTAGTFGSGRRSHSPHLCYILYYTRDMNCTTSGGVSSRKRSLEELSKACWCSDNFQYPASHFHVHQIGWLELTAISNRQNEAKYTHDIIRPSHAIYRASASLPSDAIRALRTCSIPCRLGHII